MGGDTKKHLKGGGTVINETVGLIGEPESSRRCTATLQLGISGMAEVGRSGFPRLLHKQSPRKIRSRTWLA